MDIMVYAVYVVKIEIEDEIAALALLSCAILFLSFFLFLRKWNKLERESKNNNYQVFSHLLCRVAYVIDLDIFNQQKQRRKKLRNSLCRPRPDEAELALHRVESTFVATLSWKRDKHEANKRPYCPFFLPTDFLLPQLFIYIFLFFSFFLVF